MYNVTHLLNRYISNLLAKYTKKLNFELEIKPSLDLYFVLECKDQDQDRPVLPWRSGQRWGCLPDSSQSEGGSRFHLAGESEKSPSFLFLINS